MKKIALIASTLALSACGSVYDRSIPGDDDLQAQASIRSGLKDTDRPLWDEIAAMMAAHKHVQIHSKSVGELLAKARARRALYARAVADEEQADIDMQQVKLITSQDDLAVQEAKTAALGLRIGTDSKSDVRHAIDSGKSKLTDDKKEVDRLGNEAVRLETEAADLYGKSDKIAL